MKKTNFILTTVLLSLTTAATAQKWTAGLRTGASQDNFQFNDQFAQGGNLMWSNQVFVDRRLGKHLELEASATYSQLNASNSFPDFVEPSVTVYQSWQTKNLSLAINIKYYLLQKRNWEVFGLAGLGTSKKWSHYQQNFSGTIPAHFVYSNTEGEEHNPWPILSSFNAGAGLNYKLTQHLQLSGLFQLSYKAGADTYFSSTVNQNNFAPALLAGIGYRF